MHTIKISLSLSACPNVSELSLLSPELVPVAAAWLGLRRCLLAQSCGFTLADSALCQLVVVQLSCDVCDSCVITRTTYIYIRSLDYYHPLLHSLGC
ncbi:hypothetical protein BJY01DRAFT_39604 [Aspergillus pseudoustus]|uniref:Uncharacterized protein n=1 Tax=Aspergillus pseudoustus TaxID=1810923 RepID=A0ABR4JEB2_9EURO